MLRQVLNGSLTIPSSPRIVRHSPLPCSPPSTECASSGGTGSYLLKSLSCSLNHMLRRRLPRTLQTSGLLRVDSSHAQPIENSCMAMQQMGTDPPFGYVRPMTGGPYWSTAPVALKCTFTKRSIAHMGPTTLHTKGA